jgi:hypothetical protein
VNSGTVSSIRCATAAFYGGPRATYIGGINVPFRPAEHDLSAAVWRWVEEGVASGEMVATAAPREKYLMSLESAAQKAPLRLSRTDDLRID